MIVGCYTLDLYCDGADCDFNARLGGMTPAQFTESTELKCWRDARAAGWTRGRKQTAFCPKCSLKRKKMSQTYKDILDTKLTETQSVMAIMDHTGDQKVTWDRFVPAEVDMARNTFNEWKKKKYMAYKVTEGGTRGEVLSEFDPKAERIIFTPAMAGGGLSRGVTL